MLNRIQVGRTEISYAVRTSATAKAKRLSVGADGSVLLVVPEGTRPADTNAFVQSKRKWLTQSLERARSHRFESGPQRFVSGAKLLYRGRRLMIRVEAAKVTQVEIECRSRFHVRVPTRWSAARKEAEIAVAFNDWLRERCEVDVKRLARRYASSLDVELRNARIGNQKGMWGTCGRAGTVRINWRLVQAPFAALEYVVAHEVCHLRERSHTDKFWQTLATAMPDWRERKSLLEEWEAENSIHRAL